MIQRSEFAGNVIGMIIVSVHRCHEADVLRLHRDRGQQRERFKLIADTAASGFLSDLPRTADKVGEKKCMKFRSLSQLCTAHPPVKVGPTIILRGWMTPGRQMMTKTL